MFTPEQVQELLESAKPSIIEGLKREIGSNLTWQVKEIASKQTMEAVQAWITTEVIPEVKKQLCESKDGLIAMAVQMAPLMMTALTEQALKEFKKKLESSYSRQEIFKALFS